MRDSGAPSGKENAFFRNVEGNSDSGSSDSTSGDSSQESSGSTDSSAADGQEGADEG